MMENQVIDINMTACLKVVENQMLLFANDLKEKNKIIFELRKELDACRKEKVKLANAYAKEIGVLKSPESQTGDNN